MQGKTKVNLKNNLILKSENIEYSDDTLDNHLKAMKTNINNLQPVILYENSSGVSSGTVTLNDNYTNYSKIVVITNLGGDKSLTPEYQSIISISTTEYYDTLYQNYLVATFSGNKLTINTNGSYYTNVNHAGSNKIFKIIGYK